jgi:hypothetical protein
MVGDNIGNETSAFAGEVILSDGITNNFLYAASEGGASWWEWGPCW